MADWRERLVDRKDLTEMGVLGEIGDGEPVFPDVDVAEVTVPDESRDEQAATAQSHLCDQCSNIYASGKSLARHKLVHSQELKYVCHDCGKGFFRKEALMRHCNAHGDTRPHICSLCQKSFRAKDDLTRHMKTCGQDKTLSCDICGKLFKAERYLQQHMSKHQSVSQPEIWPCHICGKTYKYKSSLYRHMVSHRTAPRSLEETVPNPTKPTEALPDAEPTS